MPMKRLIAIWCALAATVWLAVSPAGGGATGRAHRQRLWVALPAVAGHEGPAPAVGSWLAPPGLESEPVAIGVLSVGPRKLDLQPALGIVLDDSEDVARIVETVPAMPAERAGIQPGDIVRRI